MCVCVFVGFSGVKGFLIDEEQETVSGDDVIHYVVD